MQDTHKITIGIDLGTTNTCAAIVKDGVVTFLELEPGSQTMPSAVRFVDRKEEEVVIGRLAKRFAISKPKEVFVSFKSLMQNEDWKNDPKTVEHYKIGDKQLTPTDIAAKILKHIYDVAQTSHFAQEGIIDNIKICVPAASTTYYKTEVMKAAVSAGFGDKDDSGSVIYDENAQPQGISIVEEPFAAAYSYGYKNGFFDPEKSKNQNIMVYDFGGGTFDVSIINVVSEKDVEPVFKLLGTFGVTKLGGDDIDIELMKLAAKQFYKETKIDLINTNKDNKGIAKRDILMANSTLKELSERAKIEEFAQGAPEVELQQLSLIYDPEEEKDCNLDVIITREKFLEAIKPLLDKTIECAKNALQESGLTLEDINRFVLVGGSTKASWVFDAIKDFIEKDPYVADNVDVIVGEGAALMAQSAGHVLPPKREKPETERGEEKPKQEQTKPTEIRSKTSQNYGIEVRGGFFIPLIAKGLPFDEEHPSYSGSFKCTNPNNSGLVNITGWATQEDVIDRDEQGNPILDEEGLMTSSKSVHFVKQEGNKQEKLFQSLGQFSLEVPKVEPHTLEIMVTLTILKDNSLTVSVKVGDNEPKVINLCK